MEITCPKCHAVTKADVTLEVMEFGCPNCHSLISYIKNEKGSAIESYTYNSPDIALTIGQKGVFDGKEYVVTAFIVKRVHKIYYWREYILTAADGDQLFLSETDGHWIKLKEVPEKYNTEHHPKYLTHNDISMSLYEYEDTEIAQAAGFFNYRLPNGRQRMQEYINPPYILSIEVQGKDTTCFFGEHISRSEIKKIFGLSTMPYRSGVGIVQPFGVNLSNMGIIFSGIAILILVSHLFIYSGRRTEEVINEMIDVNLTSVDKDVVSKSFTLTGGTAPMDVSVQADVNNSWVSVQLALVNEGTGEEVYASKDVEYYSGYEGGEHWSEGSTDDNFSICGVPGGTYHFVITPTKEVNESTIAVHVAAKWNPPLLWNVFLPIILMFAVLIITYFISVSFEKKRWADSSNSPYEE
jgi:hypothetical protein